MVSVRTDQRSEVRMLPRVNREHTRTMQRRNFVCLSQAAKPLTVQQLVNQYEVLAHIVLVELTAKIGSEHSSELV